MKLDDLMKRRFAELAEAGAAVLGSQRDLGVPSGPSFRWLTSALGLIERVFGKAGAHHDAFAKAVSNFSGYSYEFERALGVFLAAREDYEGGWLFSVRALVKAEVLGDALEQAQEMLRAGYKDPACVLGGISLEISLKELADRNLIPLAKADRINADLAKAGVYNAVKQKQITAWLGLRNSAAHGEWDKYVWADVEGLVDGVRHFIADYL